MGWGDPVRAPSGPEGLVARAVIQEQEERENENAASRITRGMIFMCNDPLSLRSASHLCQCLNGSDR